MPATRCAFASFFFQEGSKSSAGKGTQHGKDAGKSHAYKGARYSAPGGAPTHSHAQQYGHHSNGGARWSNKRNWGESSGNSEWQSKASHIAPNRDPARCCVLLLAQDVGNMQPTTPVRKGQRTGK